MSSHLQLILLLLLLIAAAKAGGAVSAAFGQPTVFGKLLAGVVLGPSLLNIMRSSIFSDGSLGATIDHPADLGVIMLMFIAGLRIEPRELTAAGRAAISTALLGVAVPCVAGLATALLFGFGLIPAIFIGLLLTATSVSISAQTLLELGALHTRVGSTLLGAAVLDDMLGLLLLSIFLATQTAGSLAMIGIALGKLLLFLLGAWLLGRRWLPRAITLVRRLPISEPILTLALLLVLGLAFAAEEFGSLATITGAFLAGMLLSQTDARAEIDRGVASLSYALLIPLFFIGIGLHTDLRALDATTIPLTLSLCVVAVLSKIAGCGLGARLAGMPAQEAIQVGTGMVSRGEVGLIVAALGVEYGLINSNIFIVTVAVVLVSTLVTPILLKWSLNRPAAALVSHTDHEPSLIFGDFRQR